MGFLHAVKSLGMLASKRSGDSELSDLMSFLQLPYPLGQTEDKRTHVIRVWLDVEDHTADTLEVFGVKRIDLADYPGFEEDESLVKERYIHREPVGAAAPWRYSPIYKLGTRKKDAKEELLGRGWEDDKDSRFYKLRKVVLQDLETCSCFKQGSVQIIMQALVSQIDKISEYWSDKKRSYAILFGLDKDGEFIYPGGVPTFVKYFRAKLTSDKGSKAKSKAGNCALCRREEQQLQTLDKVFKFATFDKESFLPGIKDGAGVREKIFPICAQCYGLLSGGKNEMETRFANFHTVPGISLFVIPEVIFDQEAYQARAAERTKNFLEHGVKTEKKLFENLAKHDEGLVFHFMFAEPNQAQLIVHYLIEDVPPSRLKQLQQFWEQTVKAYSSNAQEDASARYRLDTAFKQIVAVLTSLAGKTDQDKVVMRDKALAIIGDVLNGDRVDVSQIKALAVSRLAGLVTDSAWLTPTKKEDLPGRLKLKGMAEVTDFLQRVNGRRR